MPLLGPLWVLQLRNVTWYVWEWLLEQRVSVNAGKPTTWHCRAVCSELCCCDRKRSTADGWQFDLRNPQTVWSGRAKCSKFENIDPSPLLYRTRNFDTDYWLVASFPNKGGSKKSRVEGRGLISHFLTLVNIRGGARENSEWEDRV